MIDIDIKSDIHKAERLLGNMKSQVPFAAARALTLTAKRIEAAEIGEMKRAFKNPTRYTLGAQYVQPATKTRLEASVWLRGSNRRRDRNYLEPHIFGGNREQTRFEQQLQRIGVLPAGWFAVPGRFMPRGSRGNVTRGTYQKVLAQLRAFNDSNQNVSGSDRSRRNRRRNAFFLNRSRRPPGIWMRKGKRVFMAFIFVQRAQYSKRFRFFEVADKTAARHWPRIFNESLSLAIRTSR